MHWDLEFIEKQKVDGVGRQIHVPGSICAEEANDFFAMCFAVIALGTDFREEADVEVITELKKKIRQRVKGE